jgi:hypothetical protein
MSLLFKIISIILVIIVVLIVGVFFVFQTQKPLDLSKVTDSQIISLLNKNSDAKDYIQSHPDFKIDKKEILTKESIVAGQNGANFREVYQGLELQDNRYMKVDLINIAGDRGLIALIDSNEKTTLRAYGLLLLKSSVNQNGQTTSQTTN